MMWFALAAVASATVYEYTIPQFYDSYIASRIGNKNNTAYSDYKAATATFYLLETADKPASVNDTLIRVVGTPSQLSNLRGNLSLTKSNRTSEASTYVMLVERRREATYYEQSSVFVTLIVLAIFIAFGLFAYLLWHFDDYSHNPANSLLFVTEGNRIVTGQ